MRDIREVILQFSSMHTCSQRQLQSLIGKLLYISKIIKPARAFLSRMLTVLRNSSKGSEITLNDSFHLDLQWFRDFSHSFNGVTSYSNYGSEPDHIANIDASLEGLGAVEGDRFYSDYLRI